MQYSAITLALLPTVIATTIRIEVGNGGLKYTPNNIQAFPGDILQFNYFPMNHSVTQSNFANPCQPLANGVNSGFVPVTNATIATVSTFNVQVNDTKPIWIYCAQGKHCNSGMSLVVNEPKNSPNTLAAYQAAAKNATIIPGPVAPLGGQFIANAANGISSSTTASSTSIPLTTYTQGYSTYATSVAGAATTVTLASTVTAIPSSALTASASASTSAAIVSKGAAPSLAPGAAAWVMAAGAAGLAGLMV